MNESILYRFCQTVREQNLTVYGIVVDSKRLGSVTHRWRSNDAENLYSGSKTFASLAVGMCQDEGRLTLSDKVLDFFPEYRASASEGSEKTTLRDLLHMASGQEVFRADYQLQNSEEDWAGLFFKTPLQHEPGTRFYYSNPCTYMLSRVVEVVSGNTLRNYLVPRLFTPLGIRNPQWHTDPAGHTLGYSALHLRTAEYARLGRLLLDHGEWQGKQIVSSEYIRLATTDLIDNFTNPKVDTEKRTGYGYQLWMCSMPGVFRTDGMYGQFSIVIPEKEAVVTVTSHEEKNPNDIIRAILQDIEPAL